MTKPSLEQIPIHDQRVVVGVDPSPGARDALRWAEQFTRRTGRSLRVVTSWSYPAAAALPGGPQLHDPAEMDERTSAEMARLVHDTIGREIPAADLLVRRGPADLALLTAAEAEDVTLMVVGKRGLGPIDGRLLGSVSRRVAELAQCPVAVVPSLPDTGPLATPDGPILVGVDASPAAAAARDWAITTARETGAELIFTHGVAGLPAELPDAGVTRFLDRARFMVEGHVEAAELQGCRARGEVLVMDPRRLLDDLAARSGAQMIVVGASGEGAGAGLLVGTVVHYVAQFARVPVVIVR